MRLYIRPIAPNALKVLIFMAERGIELETVDVGGMAPENIERVSPLRQVPVLEADRGLFIAESLTICQVFLATGPGRGLRCSATGWRSGLWWRCGSGGRS